MKKNENTQSAKSEPQQNNERRGLMTNREIRMNLRQSQGDPTFTLTIPDSILSRLQKICNNIIEIMIRCSLRRLIHERIPKMNLGEPISFRLILYVILLFSMDSDLEAFSHNPTDGSFTALAGQLTVFTNYLNQRFLSY